MRVGPFGRESGRADDSCANYSAFVRSHTERAFLMIFLIFLLRATAAAARPASNIRLRVLLHQIRCPGAETAEREKSVEILKFESDPRLFHISCCALAANRSPFQLAKY